MAGLKPGTRLKTEKFKTVEIVKQLGEGGQGIVYLVRYDGEEKALKWYFSNKLKNYDSFKKNLKQNIEKGAPSDKFLWPLDITEEQDGSFGYIMELRKPGYEEFSQYLITKVRFDGIMPIVNAALNITAGFRALHNSGYAYQDLNDGNFFIHPKTGDVLICDNDNVVPNGVNMGIAGKCRYMAPEIVTGKSSPNNYTDRFSLAVMLFLLLFMNHPLEGKATMHPCLTEEMERRYFGTNPVFIYDRENPSNNPVRGIHHNVIALWPLYPAYVREAFETSFSHEAMIEDTSRRLMDKQWLQLFIRLRGDVMRCACGDETFIDPDGAVKCLNCGREIKPALKIKGQKYNIALYPDVRLYMSQIITDRLDDPDAPFAKVVRGKNNPKQWGIANFSGKSWAVTTPDGKNPVKNNGETLRLARGLKIGFENKELEIV